MCDAGFEAIDATLSVITSTSCPRFHADHVQLRCLCTYVGEGTYFVPNKAVNRHNWMRALGIRDTNGFGVKSATSVQQATEWDVVLLKGEAFPGNQGKDMQFLLIPDSTMPKPNVAWKQAYSCHCCLYAALTA